MAKGFSKEIEKARGVKCQHFLDTVHLNRLVAAAISKSQIAINLNTDKLATYKQKIQAKNKFADSIAWLAKAEVRAVHDAKKPDTDHHALGTTMEAIIPAMIDCYQGKHTLCKIHSHVCNGQKLVYEYLPRYARGTFTVKTGQACYAQKHKNRKRRAQGARCVRDTCAFPRITPRGYLYSFLPDIQD